MERAPEGRERVEQLLRQTHILRMRGQWREAETLCRQALELDPEERMAQEMLGDLLAEKGSLDEALELYRAAHEAQPERVALEDKIARAVLRKADNERERIEMQLMLDSPARGAERKRQGTLAFLLSLVCPGAGHFLLGQHLKGGIVLVTGLVCFFIGGADLVRLGLTLAGESLPQGAPRPDGFRAVFGLLGVLIWMYGLVDTVVQAGKGAKKVAL